jgi:hypothetical protein
MALDFTTGVLDPRVTVTRALNTATSVNSSGAIEIVNANLPRFDYDPATLAPKGLLIEEARTNLLLRSEEFDSASWIKIRATVTANATTSPDGTADAEKLVEDTTASDTHFVLQTATISSSTTYTYSVFLKASERTRASLQDGGGSNAIGYFDLSNGTVVSTSGATATITNFGNGWYRCTITFTTGVAQITANCRVFLVNTGTNISYTGDGTSGIFVWGAQLELGAFATSYIPTTTTSLTRNADVVTMTGTNFSDWYNQTEGTFVTWYSSFAAVSVAAKAVVATNDGTTANRIYAFVSTSGRPTMLVTTLGAVQVNMINDIISADANAKTTTAYKVDSFAVASNGGTVTTDALGTIPTVTKLDIGCFASATQLNGHVQRLFYYPQRLLNAETQAFSK